MKKHTSLILLAAALILPISLTSGCSTNAQERAAIATTTAVFASIEAIEDAWGDYVVAGHATPAQIQRVRELHDHYLSARQMVVEAVMAANESSVDPASSQSVAQAMSTLAESSGAFAEQVKAILRK